MSGRVNSPAFILIRIVAVFLLLPTCTFHAQTVEPAAARPLAFDSELSYRIGPGDLLDVRVFNHPEMSREVPVFRNGLIRMPFIGQLSAACLTETELAELLKSRYRKYLRDPQVDVFVKDYRSQPVAVIGAVMQPGRWQLQRRVRLLELLTFAGGANLTAGSSVNLIRNREYDYCAVRDDALPKAAVEVASDAPSNAPSNASDDKASSSAAEQGSLISFKLQDLLAGNPAANVYVEPGDIVSIPEADQFFITGGVLRPGAFPLRTRIKLSEALALAGGLLPDAAKKRVTVSRQVARSEARQEETYDLEAIERRKAEDIVLQPNDVVFVPTSTAKSVGRGMLSLIVPTAGAFPLRVLRGY